MEYQFRLSRPDGGVHLDRFEYFPDDTRALAVALSVLGPAKGELAMEVWRRDECIYDSRLSRTVREGNVVPFPRAMLNRGRDAHR